MNEPQEEVNLFWSIIKKITLAVLCILILLICFSSCMRTPEERRDRRIERRYEKDKRRFAYLIKEHPEFIDTTTTIDTVTIRDTFNVFIPAKIDSTHIDSLLLLYCDALANPQKITQNGKDTVYKDKLIRRLIYTECSPEKIIGEGQKLLIHGKDTVTVNYSGNKDGLNLSIESISRQINNNKTLTPKCPDCDNLTFWQDLRNNWIKWICIFVAGGITFVVIFRRK